MHALGYRLAVAISASPMALLATPATAQNSVSYVSKNGSDGNACTSVAPCKLFTGAFAKTGAGGTIRCLDKGSFGSLNITKSIIISCENNEASTDATGFQISAPDIQVTLRGVTIQGTYSVVRNFGLWISQPSTVILEDVVLRGATYPYGGYGVWVTNTTGVVELSIKDSKMSNNRVGLRIAPMGSGRAKVVLSHSHVSDNGAGIQIDSTGTTGRIDLAVTDTVLDANTNSGLALSSGSGSIFANASRMTSANNGGHGVRVVNGSANVRISNSDITGNLVGVERINGGVILSSGNNHINYNGTNGTVSATVPEE